MMTIIYLEHRYALNYLYLPEIQIQQVILLAAKTSNPILNMAKQHVIEAEWKFLLSLL